MREREDAVVARGSGPSDRAADGVQAFGRGGGEDAVRSGEGDSGGGVERAACEMSGHHLWRYSRPVLRSHRAL